MRICLAFCAFAVFATFCHAARESRFLSPRHWAFLPDRLLRLPDHDFGAHRLDRPFPSLLRPSPLEAIFRSPNRDSIRTNETPKKTSASNVDREMEDPVEEGESKVNAEEVFVVPKKRPEPENTTEPEPVDKEIPIFVKPFNFNPLTFHLDFFTPWWKGENVCVEKSEVDESEPEDDDVGTFMINFEATQCTTSGDTYICTKKVRRNGMKKTYVVKHQCCHGFVREKSGKGECRKVPMEEDVILVMEAEACSKFADLLKRTSLKEKVQSENFTIFAPNNEAMSDFEEDEVENNEIMHESPKKDFSYLVGGHIIEGIRNIDSIKDDEVLPSINGKSAIRLNKYRSMLQTIMTANCVPVISKNNMAKNGLVHVVANILPLPRKSVSDVILASPKLSVFAKLLGNSKDLVDELEDPNKAWTIFAPTDKAFQNMDSDMLQRLLTGEGCFENILRNHMAKGTYCSASIMEQYRIRNALGKPISVRQEEVNRFSVEGVKISDTDIVGTNGVIHFIDEVMIPSEAKGFMDALKERKDMMELIKLAKMESTFENLNNVTVFVPSEDAIKSISNETRQEWEENPDKLQETLMYHMVSPRLSISQFKNNEELPTFAEDRNLRLQLHEMFPGSNVVTGASAQCSLIMGHDREVCGGVIHYLDKVLTPPKGTIMEVLKDMDKRGLETESETSYKTLIKLFESSELESKLEKENEGPYTLLAPTDKAFEKIEKNSLQELLDNKTRAEQILRMHVLPEMFCCSGVSAVAFPFFQHYVKTMEGNLMNVHRRYLREGVRFGPAKALECDITARNGLIHSVNRVILPNRNPEFSIFDPSGFGFRFK